MHFTPFSHYGTKNITDTPTGASCRTTGSKIMEELQGSYSATTGKCNCAAESQLRTFDRGIRQQHTQAAINCNASDMVIAGNLIGLKPDGL
jgi:dTDP-4-amino-4,6-dideoxygalactose transaminase